MGWMRGIGATAKDRQNGSQALRSWLSTAKDIQTLRSRCAEIGCAMDVEIEVKRASYKRL